MPESPTNPQSKKVVLNIVDLVRPILVPAIFGTLGYLAAKHKFFEKLSLELKG